MLTSYSMTFAEFPVLSRALSKTYTGLLNVLFGLRLRYYNGLTLYPLEFLNSIRVRGRTESPEERCAKPSPEVRRYEVTRREITKARPLTGGRSAEDDARTRVSA